jgi:Domain of unknown function (DUF4281)
MQWETIFALANLWPLPFWLLLALGPRTETTARIVLYGGVAMLALAYAILLPLIMGGWIDAAGPANSGSADFTSLAGVMAVFDSKGGATVGWLHYLAFDLLTGLWVARNADQYGYHRLIQIVILFFVLMAGPLGLTLYLLLRLTCKNPPKNAAAPH